MNTVLEKNRTVNNQIVKENIVDSLYEAYDKLSYKPEYYNESTLIISNPLEFIVHFIDNDNKLSLGELHIKWTSLKEISEFTGIKSFLLISKSGYEEECFSAEGYAVRLEDMSYVDELTNSSLTNPPLELLPHNHKAYKDVAKMFNEHKEVAITHATGTGKSYIISKLIMDNNGHSLVICPTVEIIKQFKELFQELNLSSEKVTCMTYSKVSRLTEDELNNLKFNLIIIDEYHRAGAETWGAGLRTLIDYNPNAKLFGTTATPIRYLDDRRNMADELFNNNIASSLDLFESIARGILPVPKYIEALYDISDDLSILEDNIRNSKNSTASKEELLEDIRRFKISWDSVKTISGIINKHYTKDIKRAIVFCKDINHIKKVSKTVQNWFESSNVYTKANICFCYSSNNEKANDIEIFKSDVPTGEINLLFSIDKITEGVHIDGVDSVIFLRSTESNNVLLQQIGRGLAAASERSPVILDLVNNVKILGGYNFFKGISNAIDIFNTKKNKDGLLGEDIEDIDIDFNIIDETKDFMNFLKESSEALLTTWDDNLAKAVECKKRTGWFPGPMTPDEDPYIINWVERQRALETANQLSPTRYNKLVDAGFIFSFAKEKWVFMYNNLLKYKEDNNISSFLRVVIKDKELRLWVQNQRRRKILNIMSDEEYKLLKEVGISCNNVNADIWDYYINKLIVFYEENGHMYPSENQDSELTIFCRVQRRRYLEGNLPEDRIDLLESIGFPWEQIKKGFTHEERVEDLKKYKEQYGHVNINSRCREFNNIGDWVKRIRVLNRKNQLPQHIFEAVNSLGFIWEPKKEASENTVEEVISHILAKRDNPNLKTTKSISDTMNRFRKKKIEGILDDNIIKQLDEAGFVWNPTGDKFNHRLNQLTEYHKLYGTFKVSTKTGFPDATQLRNWVNKQKSIYKSETGYQKDREIALNAIGFYFEKEIKK